MVLVPLSQDPQGGAHWISGLCLRGGLQLQLQPASSPAGTVQGVMARGGLGRSGLLLLLGAQMESQACCSSARLLCLSPVGDRILLLRDCQTWHLCLSAERSVVSENRCGLVELSVATIFLRSCFDSGGFYQLSKCHSSSLRGYLSESLVK